ncbi:MAG: hypothetical protein R3D27_12505 [Hyphomicrobiaceae bacterium]
MSKRFETCGELPTYDEMQAAMRVGRRLRAEAFAEFFGFGATKKEPKPTAPVVPGLRPVAAGC